MAAGTIENTVKGRVTGTLKIAGLDGVVTLDLQGNAHPDMAGCILQFANPHATPIDRADTDSFRREQVGHAGDISASQKRKVPKGYPNVPDDFSFDPSDFVLTNILYLEWFDHYNGAVVIEGVGYKWQIDLPRWKLNDKEVELQAGQSSDARNLFMNLAMEQYEDDQEEELWDGEDEDDWGDEEDEDEEMCSDDDIDVSDDDDIPF